MSYQVSSPLALQFRRSAKHIFKFAAIVATLYVQSERFLLFFIYKFPRYIPDKRNTDFQDVRYDGHLGLLIGTIFAYIFIYKSL